jgi:hypothetical protein
MILELGEDPMEREVSHAEIYRELGVLQGKMDSLILHRTKDDQDKADMFRRLGLLENRMAQVVLIAVLASLILPSIISFLTERNRLDLIQAPAPAVTPR